MSREHLQERVGEWAAQARPNATAHTLQMAVSERMATPEALQRHTLAEAALTLYEIAEHLGINLDHEMQHLQLHRESSLQNQEKR